MSTADKMRLEVMYAYTGIAWTRKVSKMSNRQIFAIHRELEKRGKIGPGKQVKQRDIPKQLNLFDDFGLTYKEENHG